MKQLFTFATALFCTLNTFAQTPQLVHDFTTDPFGGMPGGYEVFNNKLYMIAEDGDQKIWSYDGQNAPVVEVDMYASSMCAFNDKLYFAGVDGIHGRELMVYDGVNQPMLVSDILSGTTGSNPKELTVFNNKLFFVANDSLHGTELYAYDGVNPPVLYDIRPGMTGSNIGCLCVFNNKLYFHASENSQTSIELYAYNPTLDDVFLAADIEPGGPSRPQQMMVMNNKMYLIAKTNAHGKELYEYDGIMATHLTDIGPNSAGGLQAHEIAETSAPLIAYNGQLYFSAQEGNNNYGIWKYDPATNATALVHDVNPTINMYEPAWIAEYANKLFFCTDNNINGFELWVHDGTNTSMVADLCPGGCAGVRWDTGPTVYNGKLYFSGDNGTSGFELYSFTDAAAGIKNESLKGEITIAPNPASGDVMLTLSLQEEKKLQVIVTDITGAAVWQRPIEQFTTGESRVSIALGENAAGMYLYQVVDDKGVMMASGKVEKR